MYCKKKIEIENSRQENEIETAEAELMTKNNPLNNQIRKLEEKNDQASINVYKIRSNDNQKSNFFVVNQHKNDFIN